MHGKRTRPAPGGGIRKSKHEIRKDSELRKRAGRLARIPAKRDVTAVPSSLQRHAKGSDVKRARLELISGGQTGADRAALDFAIAHGLPHSGWCPKGRRAEDGKIHPRYKLRQTPSRRYAQRTRRNALDADATAIFSKCPLVGGTVLTLRVCHIHHKPVVVLSPARGITVAVRRLRGFLRINHVRVLNVAGPRASTDPGIYDFTIAVLSRAFRSRKASRRAVQPRPTGVRRARFRGN